MTDAGSRISVGVCTATHSVPSKSSFVAAVFSRTSPPISSMRSVIISHIWPGP